MEYLSGAQMAPPILSSLKNVNYVLLSLEMSILFLFSFGRKRDGLSIVLDLPVWKREREREKHSLFRGGV